MAIVGFAHEMMQGMFWLAAPILFLRSAKRPVYKDFKNGYFSFVPPKSWRVEEYEDARTNVEFVHPFEPRVYVRLIVREAPNETFDVMKRKAKAKAQKWWAKSLPCAVDTAEWLGVPAAVTSAEVPGVGHTRFIRFLKGGLEFNIQYVAPDKKRFYRYLNDVALAVNSIVLGKGSETVCGMAVLEGRARESF